MKRFFIILVVLIVLASAGYIAMRQAENYLHSESFINDLEGYMSEVVYAPVDIKDIELINLSSAKMKGFHVPLNFAIKEQIEKPSASSTAQPVLILAEESIVEFDGVPSMEGKSTMAKLTINAPVVWLEQLDDGAIAWPKFSTKIGSDEEAASVEFKEIIIKDASVSITGKDGFTAMQMKGADVTGAFTMTQGVLTGRGRIEAKQVILGGKIEINDFSSPIVAKPKAMELNHIKGTIYEGQLEGKMTISPAPKSQPMTLTFEAKGVNSSQFMKAFGLASPMDIGQVSMSYNGGGELLEPLQIKGQGKFKTTEFNGDGVPVVAKMEKMAKDFNLAKVNFDSLYGDLATDQGIITFTDVESLPDGKNDSRLFAHGTVNLKGDLNMAGYIQLHGGVVGSIENFFHDAGFLKKGESLMNKKFKVTGTTADPKIDM